jgi:WD40 repeat protein
MIRSFEPQDAPVRSLAFRPDGKILAAGTDQGAIRLWDVEYYLDGIQYAPGDLEADATPKAEKKP